MSQWMPKKTQVLNLKGFEAFIKEKAVDKIDKK